MPVTIRYAETDKDCTDVHLFLCVVAKDVLFCEVDPIKSMNEVMRVRDEGASLIADFTPAPDADPMMVGVLGVVLNTWWYGDKNWLTDRWFFVAPNVKNLGVAAALQAEAAAIGRSSNIDVIINGKMKRRSNGVYYTSPKIINAREPGHNVLRRH